MSPIAASWLIDVTAADGNVQASISDDGTGGADPTSGSGLRGLADRVEALRGSLNVSNAKGDGATVVATVPLG